MPTAREFIESWPLYTRAAIRNFSAPDSISRVCDSKECGKETTWFKAEPLHVVLETDPQLVINAAGYTCTHCKKNSMAVLYCLLDYRNDKIPNGFSSYRYDNYHASVQKVGQTPPQSIDIGAELRNRLGSTAEYYKQALVCKSQNYGIGALAYLRRVVEEKTDELIDVVVELAATYNVPGETIEQLQKAKQQVQYEEKLRVASEVIPDALRPGGVNPLGQLHKHLSVGLHGKSDDQCIAIFNDLQSDFEYVFRNLHVEAEQRREFAKRVQERAGRGVPKA